MFILVDKQTNKIIDTLQVVEIIDDKWIKSAEGSLIQLDFCDVFEVESVPANAKYYKDGKFSVRLPEEVELEVQEIQKQIDAIDKKSIRDAEDLCDLLIKRGLIVATDAPFMKERTDQKKQLREALKNIT
jgi:hypothetical protein